MFQTISDMFEIDNTLLLVRYKCYLFYSSFKQEEGLTQTHGYAVHMHSFKLN